MAEEALVIRAYEESDRYVLVLSGELDMSGVAAFESAAVRLCELGAGEVLVDITKIDFIDSTGLRAILTVKAACEQRGCHFSMSHGSGQPERLFELTRLVERLPFRKSGVTRQRREIDLFQETAGGDEGGPAALA
jgi:anti-sigma B factor antagonist